MRLPEGEQLFKMCARLYLSEIESEAKKDTKKRLKEVSLQYGVLASQTSFVAVQKLKAKASGEVKPVVIPIAITKDTNVQD